MISYEDETIELDNEGVRIKNYRGPGDSKYVPYNRIQDFEVFEVGFWTGRHRLVGIPMGRPHNWFHWNRKRSNKNIAIGLETGRWIRPTIVPDDALAVQEILQAKIQNSNSES